jgi:hypothetical protein
MTPRNVLLVCAALLFSVAKAQAQTSTVPYLGTEPDPAEDFETRCLGATMEPDCDAREATLKAELTALLASLEHEDDAASVAIFQDVLKLSDPLLRAIAVQYFQRHGSPPSDFWGTLKTFLFGRDESLGVSASESLRNAPAKDDQGLGTTYREQRSFREYFGGLESDSIGDDPLSDASVALPPDTLLSASLKDMRLALMDSFAPQEQFAPADRLLLIDRYAPTAKGSVLAYPVTGFVTDATVAEVTAFFTELFGTKPYASFAESRARYEAVTKEIASLQAQLLTGDLAAVNKVQQLSKDLVSVQDSFTMGATLQTEALKASDHVFWVDGTVKETSTGVANGKLPRAVIVGTDAQLGRTVIRYVNGVIGSVREGVASDAGVAGSRDAGASAGSEPEGASDEPGSNPTGGGRDAGRGDLSTDDDDDDDDGDSGNKHGGGGGCTLGPRPNGVRASWMVLAIAALAAFVFRRRRLRPNRSTLCSALRRRR